MAKRGRRGNNEGSITQRKDGRWQGSVKIGMNPETGAPKRAYFYGKTRKEVQEKIQEALGKVKEGTFAEPSKLTFGEWLDTWLNDYMKMSLRPTTWASYETQAKKHIKPALGHIKLQNLTTDHLQKLYNEKLEGGRADKKKGGLSPRSVRYIHQVIHGALEQAVRGKKISINPANAVVLPKINKKEIQSLDTKGTKAFLQEAKKTRHYTAYLTLLVTGIRRGELLALRWKDVDLEEGTITINRNLVRTKEGLIFQEPKTELSRRTINIKEDIIKELKTNKAKQAEMKLKLGKAYQDNNLVFCNEDGKSMDPRSFAKHFERMIERLQKKGFSRITLHGLRHTFATLSIQEGVDLRTIQETLGHYDPSFTMRTYSHVTNKMRREASSKIGNLIASLAKE